MSLVAYADSDHDSDEDNNTVEEINKSPADNSPVDVKSTNCKLLLKLPEPKTKEETIIPTDNNETIDEDKVNKTITLVEQKDTAVNSFPDKQLEISLLPTLALPKPKSGGKIQITIPLLSDFNDDDEDYQPKRKMIKPSNSGCGLFSMLPNPKNQKTAKITTNTSMVPRQTTRKVAVPKQPLVRKTPEIKLFEKIPIEVEEEEADDDNEEMDFLGLNKINEVSDAEPIAGFELPVVTSNSSVIEEEEKVFGPVYCPEDTQSDVYEDDETKLILDSNALKQLGDRDKNPIKQVEVINVNMGQVLEESQQWLQKNMTEEYAESRNMGDINVSGQSKRKHQITYLAQQAKANELKLKNMWAENRLTKRQTQAKYGF